MYTVIYSEYSQESISNNVISNNPNFWPRRLYTQTKPQFQ